jgi:glycosyltransferase involved in cell wall biosynthesis
MLGWELPPTHTGGLGIHCYYLTKELAKKGIEIDFYMPKVDKVESSNVNIIQIAPTTITPYYAEKSSSFFQKVSDYNKKCVSAVIAKSNYDIIHCHDWLTVLAGVELKNTLKKPLVLTIHSTEYDRTANLSPWDRLVDIEAMGIRQADRIITVSKRTKLHLIKKYNAEERKIKVIYNAIDPSKFKVKQRYKKSGERIVLYFGRLTVQKGPDFFIKAAKKVLEVNKNVRFVIAGSGEMLIQLIELTVNLGIQDKVMFTGHVKEEQLPNLYAIADVFVLPSVSEPFGIAPLEAMACGVPVIVSKTSGVSELIRNCLLVDFWNVDEMANKILAVLKYEELYRTLHEQELLEIMDKRFSWERAAEETIAVYNELI